MVKSQKMHSSIWEILVIETRQRWCLCEDFLSSKEGEEGGGNCLNALSAGHSAWNTTKREICVCILNPNHLDKLRICVWTKPCQTVHKQEIPTETNIEWQCTSREVHTISCEIQLAWRHLAWKMCFSSIKMLFLLSTQWWNETNKSNWIKRNEEKQLRGGRKLSKSTRQQTPPETINLLIYIRNFIIFFV